MKLIKLLSLVVLFQSMSFGAETTYHIIQGSDQEYRHFFQVSKENGAYKVLELEQVRGDFPRILSSQAFIKETKLNKYLAGLKKLSPSTVSILEDWDVIIEKDKPATDSQRKIFGFGSRNKNLWEAKYSWSDEWEEKLAQWVQENVSEDFFEKYGISTDCADAVLGIRWIFARIHGLPVANHIASTGSLFTNYSMPKDWRKIPKGGQWHQDQLFKTALNYVMRLASTRTIKLDSYPVALTKKGLLVGSFILTESEESNHVKIISENHFDDPTDFPIFTLASTVPRKVRPLVREVVTDQGWPREGEKSFLKFRWPIVSEGKVYLRSATSHSDYSMEQFDSTLREEYPIFIEFLLGRLKETYDPQNLIQLALDDITDYVHQRIKVVNEGAAFCAQNDCSAGTANWDAWSTPSRDKKLKEKFANIDLLTSQFEKLSPGLVEKWQVAQSQTTVQILEYNLSLKTIRFLIENGNTSSDPTLTVEQRWGIDIDGTANELVSSTISLLEERKSIIDSQWQDCSPKDCFAKTSKWLSWNTYKVDEKLLKNYIAIKELCRIYGGESCLEMIFGASPSFDSGTEDLSLNEWFQRIPLFYSDLNVKKDRRWGKVDEESRPVLLEYSKGITFSKTSYALVDNKKVINQRTGKIVLQAQTNEVLEMASNGSILIHNLDLGTFSISKVGYSSRSELKNFNLAEGMSLEIQSFTDSVKMSAVQFSSVDKRRSYIVVFNKAGEVIIPAQVAKRSVDGELILATRTKEMINFQLGTIQKVSTQFKIENLTPIQADKERILFDYRDENYGVNYPVLIKGDREISLGIKETKNVNLKYASLEQDVFFLDYLVAEEFPEALVATLSTNGVQTKKVGNQFSQVNEVNGQVYFSTLTGSAWDHSRIPEFKLFNEGKVSELKSGVGLQISHFGTTGLFLRADDIYTPGAFVSYSETQINNSIAYASYLRSNEQFCGNTYNMRKAYVEQFSYQHGDYNCFGSLYKDESKEVPLLTLKFRAEDNLFVNLVNHEFQVVEFIGVNTVLWWSK